MSINPTIIAANNNSGTFTSGTSVTVSSTGSVPANALMIVTLTVGGATAPSALTPPSGGGWTTYLATTANGSGATIVTAVFIKINTTAGSFSGSFSWTTTATSGQWVFTAWNNCGNSGTDGSAATSQNASGTKTSPSVTPTAGDVNATLICGIFGGAVGTETTFTQPSGMTSVFLSTSSSSQSFVGLASLALTSASATGTKTWTFTTSRICMGLSFLLFQGQIWEQTAEPMLESADELVRESQRPMMLPGW